MARQSRVKDMSLAAGGKLKVEWARARMPVMRALAETYAKTKPLTGHRIAGCLHVTKETAVLIEALVAAGAEVAWSGCNPLSTQDDVAAAIAETGVEIHAWHGMDTKAFYDCIEATLAFKPTLTLDDGADLIMTVHQKHSELARQIVGGTEETTTGVHRLRAMGRAGKLLYPVLAINDTTTKWEFDNVYGTGQSSLDGILRATNVLVAGKNLVVAGYGHCGRGCATMGRGMGASTLVTEIEPKAALRACLDGHQVMPMDEACRIAEIFITATGMKNVLVKRHFEAMRDGAVLCNTGHYDCEINVADLKSLAKTVRTIRPHCEEYLMPDGRRIYLIAQGRLVNLAAAEGHPSEVMDMSFANQFMGMIRIAKEGKTMTSDVHDIAEDQDRQIAHIKLSTMGLKIDTLTAQQSTYADDYLAGT